MRLGTIGAADASGRVHDPRQRGTCPFDFDRHQDADQQLQRDGVITSTTPSGGAAAYGEYFDVKAARARSRRAPSAWTAAVPSIRIHHNAVQSSA